MHTHSALVSLAEWHFITALTANFMQYITTLQPINWFLIDKLCIIYD